MDNQLVTQDTYLQMMPLEQAKSWYDEFVLFSKSILKSDLDFGIIPGTPKPTLYKAGAEKMRFVYGYGVEFDCIDKILDLDKPFIKYTYRCTIVSKTGQKIAQCEGSCNSMEPKFGYLWKQRNELPANFDTTGLPVKTTGKKISELEFAINKGETTGQYGKPAEYWQRWKDSIAAGKARKITRKKKDGSDMPAYELDESVTVYRILNPDVIGVDNTLMKMAQKRSFVGATLLATGASEFFTQDIEDMEIGENISSQSFEDIPHEDVVVPPPAAPKPKETLTKDRLTKVLELIKGGDLTVVDKLSLFTVNAAQQKLIDAAKLEGEKVLSAIAGLDLATTSQDIEDYKGTLDAVLLQSQVFMTALGKRMEVIMAEKA